MSKRAYPTRALRVALGVITLLAAAAESGAQTPVSLTISGNDATGRIDLPGGFSADLTISFEHADGLTPDALDVSASLVSSLDLSILTRLPVTGVGIPAGFPVLVRIDPAVGSALAFSGVATVSLHTHNLDFVPGSPLVLYSAHQGGDFHDITREAGSGSYRVSGSSGTFSEFLIVADVRAIDVIIGEKLDALDRTLADNAASIALPVLSELQTRLAQLRSLWQSGSTAAAVSELDAFSDLVRAESGSGIPNVWRAGDPSAVNLAGLLRAGADTLRFSLNRKAAGSL